MAHDPLIVWLYGTPIGRLTAPRFGRVQFQPSDEAIDRWGPGSIVLSVALPLNPVRPTNDRSLRFFDGLLPEGNARTSLERRFGIRRGDTFGLLAALGRDSAGALILLPEDEPPSEPGAPVALTDDELGMLITGLDERPLGADRSVRVSLAGQQDKLLGVRLADGRWARPEGGHPSTHILKPEDPRFPGYAANESLCMRLARAIGLTTVMTEVVNIVGSPTIVVERYDRDLDAAGTVRRIHQEDMCQALSIDSVVRDRKYERDGGPSLRDIAVLLDRFGTLDDRDRLFQSAAFNVVIGNSDAHGRNFSLVHEVNGTIRLAPLYDVSSIVQYSTAETSHGPPPINHDLAMAVNGMWNINSVRRSDLIHEGTRWGMVERRASSMLDDVIDRIASVLDALDSLDEATGRLADNLKQRCSALRSSR